MAVSNAWLVNVNVSINTTVVQTPAFNYCAIVGVMPTQSSPYQCPPSSWSSAGYQSYSSLAQFETDFSGLVQDAVTVGDLLQANRFQWLLNAVSDFFGQTPTPSLLYVFQLPTPINSSTNFATFFSSMTALNNSWYGFSIADQILPSTYSTCIVEITTNAAVTIPAGTVVTPKTAQQSYTLLQAYTLPSAGTYNVPFYSTDGITAIPISTFTAISPSLSAVTGVTNAVAAVNGKPGVTTPASGIIAGLTALRSSNNQKKLFLDTNDPTIAGTVQNTGGSLDLAFFYHSLNFQEYNAAIAASFAAANLGAYFVNLFAVGIGLLPLSSMQVAGQPIDPTITTGNIGTPGQQGSNTNLIGWNNNVYANFGSQTANNVGLELVQYGYMSISTATKQIYLDQVVGADFVQFTAQADMVTFLVSQQPLGGVLYSNYGIQQIVNTFKNSIQKAVTQNILQQPSNSDFVFVPYQQVNLQDIANRIYQDLTFNGQFLSRIQRIAVTVNLSL